MAPVGAVLGAFLVLLAMGGCSSDRAGAQGGRAQGSDTLRVSGYVVTPRPLAERLLTTGTLRASEEVELASEAAGKITRIHFDEGSRVRQGQLLVQINDAELQAERARLQSEMQLAERRADRQEQLLEMGGVSREALEEAANRVSVLQAELQLVEARIEKAKVRAPFTGIIGLRYVSAGSYVAPQTRIATLRSLSPLKLDLSVPQRYAGRVQRGDTVRFTTSGSEVRHVATVYALESGISEDTRVLQLRARYANADEALLPGAFVDAEFVFDEIADALVVPGIAVLSEQGGSRVFVAEGGQAAPRTVTTGIRMGSTVQVVRGLSARDTVLTSALQELRAGAPVRVDVPDSGPADPDPDPDPNADTAAADAGTR